MAEVKQESENEVKHLFEDLAGGLMQAYMHYEKLLTEKDLNQQQELKYEVYSILLSCSDEIKDFNKAFRRQFGVKEADVRKRLEAEEAADEKKE